MAAAYAALVSLMNVMDNVENHPRLSNSFDKNQIASLGEKFGSFLEFIENLDNSHGGDKEAEDLESQIASTAHEAEDIIESHIVDQTLAGSFGQDPSFLHGLQKMMFVIEKMLLKFNEKRRLHRVMLDLQKLIEKMDSIKKKVEALKKKRGLKDQQPKSHVPVASSRPLTTAKTTVVGFDSYLHQLCDWLIRQLSDRQIICITGMGGIGKTTLARNVYEHSNIVQHFDIRAWVTVSQDYSAREILFKSLSCLGESTSGLDRENENELGEKLRKILFHRRYLIILDDMWTIEAWNKINSFFPENYNGSRIIVTTRQSNVANHLGSSRLAVEFLDDDSSWDLFCEKAFAAEGCPPQLEEIGKEIVKKCKGLPLSIVVVGGLLQKSSKTQEDWGNVAKDISSILNSADDNRCLKILSLSYNHLPTRLKPCFLYLGIFPEDHEICVSQLTKQWIAEGFIKPNKDQSLEEVAKRYIADLIDRNLILACKLGMTGKLKTCKIHDLLRDLCIRVAEEEKLFCVMKEVDNSRDIDRERRILIHGSIAKEQVLRTLESKSLARSVVGESKCMLSSKSRFLRVLYNVSVDSSTIFQQVNLRFLLLYPMNKTDIPPSISLLWNLQTISNIDEKALSKVVAPSEIWEMRQLRHLMFYKICLPDPPPRGEQDGIVLQNLQTLGRVLNFRFSEEACRRMPNIKKLHVLYDDLWGEGEASLSNYCLYNVGRLSRLESLKCEFGKVPNRDDLLPKLMFLRSIKKLSIENCGLDWNDLRIIGSLPHLEVLKLKENSVTGHTWNPGEGEFLGLKHLRIDDCSDLILWNADSSHFPVLESLVLGGLPKLDEIPSGIGEIPTLERICVYDCRFSAAFSAMRILAGQERLGNEGLQVEVFIVDKEEAEVFRKRVEQEGFTSLKFQLYP